jgi:hypothetical protein
MTPMKVAGDILADTTPPAGVVLMTTTDGIKITGPGSHPVIVSFYPLDFGDLDDVDEYRSRVAYAVERAGGDA